ncbi:MAG: ROK family protein [Thermomicrobiales bacterium]|nr:ROK family protein [Thermomicrobiales bacterium]
MRQTALAVDLGGTNLRVAVVSADGDLRARRHEATRAKAGPDIVVAQLAALVDEVCRAAEVPADAPLGIAIPGPLDPSAEVVSFTPNLAGWRDFPVGAALRQQIHRPIALGNDGNCAALGEATFGVARGVGDLVYLALGTGVGGGIISNGRLLEGAHGLGAEVGHVVVAMDGPRCTCGSLGCLEAFVSGWAIERDATIVATTADGARLRELAGDGPVKPGHVAQAALEGVPSAIALLERAGRALGAALGAFVNLFAPEAIVIGGGIERLGEPLLGPARRAIANHSFPAPRAAARLEISALGGDTALYGAAALALERAR